MKKSEYNTAKIRFLGRDTIYCWSAVHINETTKLIIIIIISIYTLSDLGVLSNLIGLLSLANEHY